MSGKKTNSKNETPQLAMENTPTTHQPIEINESVIHDVELENTIKKKKKDNTIFFSKHIMILNADGC